MKRVKERKSGNCVVLESGQWTFTANLAQCRTCNCCSCVVEFVRLIGDGTAIEATKRQNLSASPIA